MKVAFRGEERNSCVNETNHCTAVFFAYGCFAYRIDKIGFADSSVQDMKREQGMQLFYRNAMGIRKRICKNKKHKK